MTDQASGSDSADNQEDYTYPFPPKYRDAYWNAPSTPMTYDEAVAAFHAQTPLEQKMGKNPLDQQCSKTDSNSGAYPFPPRTSMAWQHNDYSIGHDEAVTQYENEKASAANPAIVRNPVSLVRRNSQTTLPNYLTGNTSAPSNQPTYPAYINTKTFPDNSVRSMLQSNNTDVMFLTLEEAYEVLSDWGWQDTKQTWVSITQSDPGQIAINYGTGIKDVVTTSMIIAALKDFGIRATVYLNHKGTEMIKFTGYSGIRKVLNAPTFGLKNPKVVDLGIGKYGLKNSIISGARVTFYVAAAYRVLDFILNDDTSLAEFIGSLATDAVKIGIGSAIAWGAGAVLVTPFVAANLAIVVVVGLVASIGLNYLDNKYHLTDKVVQYIERAQQEMIEQARKIEDGFWDLGKMFIDGLLETGKEVIEQELKQYIRQNLSNITIELL